MDEGFGLLGEEALLEQLGLALDAFVEGELGGGFNGIDGGERCDQVALLLTRGFTGGARGCRFKGA